MLSLAKPNQSRISQFLQCQAGLQLSYPEVGATNGTPPTGYTHDHAHIHLGVGETTFRRAIAGIRAWRQFDVGWVEACRPLPPIEVGVNVALLARVLGVWSLSACRVVYVIEEVDRFGFAYGTLPDHPERGEELFLVEWDRSTGHVGYQVSAFFQPRQLVVRLAWPYLRCLVNQFRRQSAERMAQFVRQEAAINGDDNTR